ncbi:MAG: RNA pyrophosphohydrolase [Rhodospirillales bacterium]|nr:MAG: RNA pyrophosphohydrolase [Rhodospirillales bacterium]
MSQDKPYRQGVGIVLLNQDGLVFAGCRADREEEAWQLPQGGVEPGESLDSAACRELNEEIGTDKSEVVAVLQMVTRYDYPPEAADTERGRQYRGQEHHWVVMRFTGQDADIDLAKSEGEFRAWRWLSPQEVVTRVAAFKRSGYVAVFEELAITSPP